MSNYPPGHPSGVSYSEMIVECPNGHEWAQHITYERDTNASYPKDDEWECPECGEEPVGEGREAEYDPDPDDREYDAMRDREAEGW